MSELIFVKWNSCNIMVAFEVISVVANLHLMHIRFRFNSFIVVLFFEGEKS